MNGESSPAAAPVGTENGAKSADPGNPGGPASDAVGKAAAPSQSQAIDEVASDRGVNVAPASEPVEARGAAVNAAEAASADGALAASGVAKAAVGVPTDPLEAVAVLKGDGASDGSEVGSTGVSSAPQGSATAALTVAAAPRAEDRDETGPAVGSNAPGLVLTASRATQTAALGPLGAAFFLNPAPASGQLTVAQPVDFASRIGDLLSSFWRTRPNQRLFQPDSGLPGYGPDAVVTELAATESAASIPEGLTPHGSDLLAEHPSGDASLLDEALRQYLEQAGDMGGSVVDLMAADGLRPWLVGAALATAAAIVARRQARGTRPALALAGVEGHGGPSLPNLVPDEA